MSDVYTPPQSDLLGTPVGGQSGGPGGRGVYPADVGTLFSKSWELIQPALVPAALGTLALFAIHMMVNIPLNVLLTLAQAALAELLGESSELLALGIGIGMQIGVGLLGQFTATLLILGLAKGSHKLVTEGTVEVGDFLPLDPMLIFKGFLTQLLLGLIVLVGFIFLIVPGIIAALGLMMWPYAMVVEGLGPINALKRSWQLMDGAKLQLFLFGLAVGVVSMFVMPLTCFFGLLVLMPFMYVGYALIYVGAAENKPGLEYAG